MAKLKLLQWGRRLRALQAAVLTRPDLASVPVMVTTDTRNAAEWVSVESAAREALHPVDEILAYKVMAEVQNDVKRIAQRLRFPEPMCPLYDPLWASWCCAAALRVEEGCLCSCRGCDDL